MSDAASSTSKEEKQREFDLGDILSVTTGKLVSPRLIDGIYDILNFMTGDSLFTHQLPRAIRECAPSLLQQHPQLKDVGASGVNQSTWKAWIDEQYAKFGRTLMVRPIPADAHEIKHPIDEAVEMGAQNIIACDGSPDSVKALISEVQNHGAAETMKTNEASESKEEKLMERAIEAANLATEHQRNGDSVKAIACAIIAAQLLALHKVLYRAPNNPPKQ